MFRFLALEGSDMKFIALKELPQGQQPGEEFDTTEEMGNVLILVGAAKRKSAGYERRDMQPKTKAVTQADTTNAA